LRSAGADINGFAVDAGLQAGIQRIAETLDVNGPAHRLLQCRFELDGEWKIGASGPKYHVDAAVRHARWSRKSERVQAEFVAAQASKLSQASRHDGRPLWQGAVASVKMARG
jgi:hypothetical protein